MANGNDIDFDEIVNLCYCIAAELGLVEAICEDFNEVEIDKYVDEVGATSYSFSLPLAAELCKLTDNNKINDLLIRLDYDIEVACDFADNTVNCIKSDFNQIKVIIDS